MTEERLHELIAQGESLTVEFKGEESRPLSDDELVEAIVCLANRPEGDFGWLLLGVEDDGKITGAHPRHGDTVDPLCLQALIANRTRPSLSCRVETLTVQGKLVVVIAVPREAALVEARGERKGRTWHLSAATYRRLGQPAAYIRQRGFEPIQQEQMILQYVEKHGRITRRDAAELCKISPSQAYRLLQRLVEHGKLVQKGKKKGSVYERRP